MLMRKAVQATAITSQISSSRVGRVARAFRICHLMSILSSVLCYCTMLAAARTGSVLTLLTDVQLIGRPVRLVGATPLAVTAPVLRRPDHVRLNDAGGAVGRLAALGGGGTGIEEELVHSVLLGLIILPSVPPPARAQYIEARMSISLKPKGNGLIWWLSSAMATRWCPRPVKVQTTMSFP